MNIRLIVIPILLPILFGALLPFLKLEKPRARAWYVGAVVLANALIAALLIAKGPRETLTLFSLTSSTSIAFRIDGLSRVFGGLLAGLWPLASLYAFEYMRHSQKQSSFFAFYTMTFGIAMGIAFSANLITMYLFYELLTLCTLPLIMHEMTPDAIHAGRKYLIYSIGGAACALMGVIILIEFGGSADFVAGGVLKGVDLAGKETWLMAGFLATFFGFGVKAAVFPLHGWLPTAGVAPTPVTALLHAVAVVKAGVFAIIRCIYFAFGADFLRGSAAQYVAMGFAALTIVYGSVMAVREQHLKRRLAYSTVSNLSYIVFGAALMTQSGLAAGLTHMIFHGVMKICLFFCAGAVLHQTGREFVSELRGFGKKMPFTMFCFTVGALALTGVPGLCGFISKLNLAMAAAQTGGWMAYIGIGALICSAVLTAVYMFTILVHAYFPGKDFDYASIENVKDPNVYMKVPLAILCVLMLFFGLSSQLLVNFMNAVALGSI